MDQSNTSFFFYDLETSGISPKTSRIMQFAGQRTDMELNPIGEPYNILVKLTDDILPDPGAIVVTGITPQMTIADGINEAEFFKIFIEEIATPGTIFVGFNNIRFDDEFIRYGLYRNFYDPYEWQWKHSRSRWDILDLTRITRALRPEGIKWPFTSDGKPSNRLELLTSLNNLDHLSAHDALSDVLATISVAKLIKQKQPKLFEYFLSVRDKKTIDKFVNDNKYFVYVSGRYSAEYEKLSVVTALGKDPKNQGVFVYDLRVDPDLFLELDTQQLYEKWTAKQTDDQPVFPAKIMAFNKCPSIAPLGTLSGHEERLEIDYKQIELNYKKLTNNQEFYEKILKANQKISEKYNQVDLIIDDSNVDQALYEGFFDNQDRGLANKFITSVPEDLSSYRGKFKDQRLNTLVPLYKARNYFKLLSPDEVGVWEEHKKLKLSKDLPIFMKSFNDVAGRQGITDEQTYVLEELKLYVESIVPIEY